MSDNFPQTTLTVENPLASEVWVASLEKPWGSHFLPRARRLAETCGGALTLDDRDLGSSLGEHPGALYLLHSPVMVPLQVLVRLYTTQQARINERFAKGHKGQKLSEQ